MKISVFNIERDVDKGKLIYNTISSGILFLDGEKIEEYESLKNSKFIDKTNTDLKRELIKGNMLVDDFLDEVELIKYISNSARYNKDYLGLTIATTQACNFVCPYCYEKGIEFKNMSDETANNIVDFIRNNLKNNSDLDITWYGGEPLLAIDVIEKISEEVFKYINIDKYNASIVTNGYLLTREYAEKLNKYKVKTAQITLDGPPQIHDARRKLASGKGTFNKIIENIKNTCDLIDITIRVNIDNINKAYIEELVNILKENDIYDKVFLYVAKVDDYSEETNKNKSILTYEEFSNLHNKFTENNKTFNHIPMINPNICVSVNSNGFVIDPEGNLYKCWDEIGRKEGIIGNVKDGFEYNETFFFYNNYNPFDDKKCLECKLLPICMGGCPFQKRKRGEAVCREQKFLIDQMLDNAYKSSL